MIRQEINGAAKTRNLEIQRAASKAEALSGSNGRDFEAARLNLLSLPEAAASPGQNIGISGVIHAMSQRAVVTIGMQALPCGTEIWRDDALRWRPDCGVDKTRSAGAEEVIIIESASRSFMSRSEGPKLRPGKNFSQLEPTAVLASSSKESVMKSWPVPCYARCWIARSACTLIIEYGRHWYCTEIVLQSDLGY